MTDFYEEALKLEEDSILLTRVYRGATMGEMVFSDDQTTFKTLELPWLNNRNSVSCIPEGEYILRKRISGVVQRTSGGIYKEGWEVTNVPGRKYIMVHVGNTVDDVEGCILVGTSTGVIGGKDAVLNSRLAFNSFMKKMSEREEWKLIIKRA